MLFSVCKQCRESRNWLQNCASRPTHSFWIPWRCCLFMFSLFPTTIYSPCLFSMYKTHSELVSLLAEGTGPSSQQQYNIWIELAEKNTIFFLFWGRRQNSIYFLLLLLFDYANEHARVCAQRKTDKKRNKKITDNRYEPVQIVCKYSSVRDLLIDEAHGTHSHIVYS